MAAGVPWADAVEAAAEDAVSLLVYVQPRASRSRLVGLHDGMVKVALAAPPVDGAANKALIRWVASLLGVSRGDVQIVSGQTGRRKRVRVAGIGPVAAIRALESRLAAEA